MTASGPGFISLQVRDIDASAAFYEKYLGLARQPGPPHAIVFDTSPAAFAVRDAVPGVDLDSVAQLGLGIGVWMHAPDAQRHPRHARRRRIHHHVRPRRRPVRPHLHLRRPRRLRDHPARQGLTHDPLDTVHEVVGPWSLATSKRFWEGFTPGELAQQTQAEGIRTVFCDTDWQRVDAAITQDGPSARIVVDGPGDLDAATEQVRRLLSIDIDGRGWPDVAARDA